MITNDNKLCKILYYLLLYFLHFNYHFLKTSTKFLKNVLYIGNNNKNNNYNVNTSCTKLYNVYMLLNMKYKMIAIKILLIIIMKKWSLECCAMTIQYGNKKI